MNMLGQWVSKEHSGYKVAKLETRTEEGTFASYHTNIIHI